MALPFALEILFCRVCFVLFFPTGIIEVLRTSACKDGESSVNEHFDESVIFCQEIPFGELFSKILFKSSNESNNFRNSTKFENVFKVRF